MTLELHPVGMSCNISCKYCYEEPMRLAGNIAPNKNLKAMLAATYESFVVFGGEPLLTPMDDLEEILKYGFEHFGRNAIQTNGILITEEHIELFKKYNVNVGISFDGPGLLSESRCSMEEAQTTAHNIWRLIERGIIPSLIVTLHRDNCVDGRFFFLMQWFGYLADKGVKYINLHPLEEDNNVQSLKLSSEELLKVLITIREHKSTIKFSIFDHIVDLLKGDDKNADCVWHGCDPYTTPAVHGIDRDGSISNCGRTNKDGVAFRKAEVSGNERLLALYNTPQEYDGCKDCRFFAMCKGYCPGTAIGGDWRNRTTHCETIKGLFEYEEEKLIASGITPISVKYNLKEIETKVLGANYHGDVSHGDSFEVEVVNTGSGCSCKSACGGHRA